MAAERSAGRRGSVGGAVWRAGAALLILAGFGLGGCEPGGAPQPPGPGAAAVRAPAAPGRTRLPRATVAAAAPLPPTPTPRAGPPRGTRADAPPPAGLPSAAPGAGAADPRECPGGVSFYGRCVPHFGLFGQTDPTQMSQDRVTDHSLYRGAGVAVDRGRSPNALYVLDPGHNRVLGFASVGHCAEPAATPCSTDRDCPAGVACAISADRGADLLFGQAGPDRAACNRDANRGLFGPAGADTLCLLRVPDYPNVAEQWRHHNLDVDLGGNLYVLDVYNDRVLRYAAPFAPPGVPQGAGDAVADTLFGQPDFAATGPNAGRGPDAPDAASLYVSEYAPSARGLSVEPDGTLWVGDHGNRRVLRFRPGAAEADLVLGQADFSSRIRDCTGSRRDRFCRPMLATIEPQTGALWVIDEGVSGTWGARIVVFAPPFTSGQAGVQAFVPDVTGEFRASGLRFEDGVAWLTTRMGTAGSLLRLDPATGAVLGLHPGSCSGEGICVAAGSLGFDDDGHVWMASVSLQHAHVRRYGVAALGSDPDTLLGVNPEDPAHFRETIAMNAAGGQLLVGDGNRLLVWNDYASRPAGAPADHVLYTTLGRSCVDDAGRLWTTRFDTHVMALALPLSGASAPLADGTLRWADTGAAVTGARLTAPDFYAHRAPDGSLLSRALWIADYNGNRILRVPNGDAWLADPQGHPLVVDLVLGQPDRDTTGCNRGRGRDVPGADGLCAPLLPRFDRHGNLFVVENNVECHGNNRITMFRAADLVAATASGALFPDVKAAKVLRRPSFESRWSCYDGVIDEAQHPVYLAFSRDNRMVVGGDGYHGFTGPYSGRDAASRHWRQLWLYDDPLLTDARGAFVQGQKPDHVVRLPMGSSGELRFDEEDRLVVLDYTWARVWVIEPFAADPTGAAAWLTPPPPP